jgi:hypothetical protein
LQTRRTLGDITGTFEVRFEIDPNTFRNNQTVCMAQSKASNTWEADLCKSELDVQSVVMKCSCNGYKSNFAGLFTDSLRTLDVAKIPFPVITTAISKT